MKSKRIISCTVSIIILTMFLLSSCTSGENSPTLHTVILPDGEGYKVLSEQAIKASRGEDVEFDVQISDGFIFDSVSHGVFENGKLSINNIKTGLTVRFGCLPTATIVKTATNSSIEVEPLDKRGEFIIGTKARVKVTPFENYYIEEVAVDNLVIDNDINFDGTLDFEIDITSSLININAQCLGDIYSVTTIVYGNGIVTPSVEDIAHYNDMVGFEFIPDEDNKLSLTMFNGKIVDVEDNYYSIKVEFSIIIEAYFVDASALLMTIFDEGEVYLSREYPEKSFVNIPNIYQELENPGGGVPLSLTTEPNGEGTSYNFGALLYLTENINLYVERGEQTNALFFSYTEKEDEVVIDGFSTLGREEKLSRIIFPISINDKPVTTISANAFENEIELQEVALNSSITSIEAEAFKGSAIERFILTDALSSFSETAFSNCEELKTVELNSIYEAKDIGTLGAVARRFAELANKKRDPRYILISGSSGLFGIDGGYFNDNMDKEIIVIGVTTKLGLRFLLSVVSTFLIEGDIVVLSPEYAAHMYGSITQSADTYMRITQTLLKNSDLLKYMDYSINEYAFSGVISAVNTKKSISNAPSSTVDQYGISTVYRANNEDSYAGGTISLNKSLITKEGISFIDTQNQIVKYKKADLIFSYPPANTNALTGAATGKQHRQEFENHLRQSLSEIGISLVSSVENYLFSGKYFYDSQYHPSTEGALLRTQQLVKDLKEYYGME